MTDLRARLSQLAAQFDALSGEFRALHESLSGREAPPAMGEAAAATTVPAMAAFLALTPTREEDALLEVVLRCAMHVTDAGGAGLTLWDEAEHRLVFRAAVGDGADGILGYRVPLEGSIHGLAAVVADSGQHTVRERLEMRGQAGSNPAASGTYSNRCPS